MLECRTVPAQFFWNPTQLFTVNGHTAAYANVAANWIDGSAQTMTVAPTATDSLVFTTSAGLPVAPPSPPPGGPNTVTVGVEGPTSPPPSSPPASPPPAGSPLADCIIGTAGSTTPITFAGLSILSGYTGTVVLDSLNTTVGDFQQFSGFVAQTSLSESQRNTLTVTSSFEWAGGVLNSTDNAGIVTLDGVTNASIDAGTSTLTTGSDLKLIGGTVLSAGGNIALANDAGIEVGELCSFVPLGQSFTELLKGVNPLPVQAPARVLGLNRVINEGTIRDLKKSALPILVWNTSDTTDNIARLLVLTTNLEVTGTFTHDPDGEPIDPEDVCNIRIAAGRLELGAGRTVTAQDGVIVLTTSVPMGSQTTGRGVLTTRPSDDPAVTNPISTIIGDLTIREGAVTIAPARGDAIITPTLHVIGKVNFLSGTYLPIVYADAALSHDRWTSTDTFTVSQAAEIIPSKEGPGLLDGSFSGKSWDVIVSVKEIVPVEVPGYSAGLPRLPEWQDLGNSMMGWESEIADATQNLPAAAQNLPPNQRWKALKLTWLEDVI